MATSTSPRVSVVLLNRFNFILLHDKLLLLAFSQKYFSPEGFFVGI